MRGPMVRCTTCKKSIASYHKHDFRTCNCKATEDGNGTQIYIDGGCHYTRMGHERNADWEVVDEGTIALAAKEIVMRVASIHWHRNPSSKSSIEDLIESYNTDENLGREIVKTIRKYVMGEG